MATQKQAAATNLADEKKLNRLLQSDPYLNSYEKTIRRRLSKIAATKTRLTDAKMSLADFASGHEYFGLHFQDNEWVFREWAPNAERIFLVGDMTGWQEDGAFGLKRLNEEGVWEIRLKADRLKHLDLYRLRIYWNGGQGDRIPAYARRVVQDPQTLIFNTQVWFLAGPCRCELHISTVLQPGDENQCTATGRTYRETRPGC